MTKLLQSNSGNFLLAAMTPDSFDELLPHLSHVELSLRDVLVEEGVETQFVYFPECGLSSMVALNVENGERIEVGHVGWEGMTGHHIVHEVFSTPNRTFVQIVGTAWRLPARRLLAAMQGDAALRSLMLRYAHTHEIQLAHSALANGRYSVHERLARWILMSHDRSMGNEIHLTHEFLSLMLGVRRAGVTNEIHVLEGIHAIKAVRGVITVLDRKVLEHVAGGSYGVPEREYRRVIGALVHNR